MRRAGNKRKKLLYNTSRVLQMIMIISDEKDISTSEILRWLDFFDAKWIRLNDTDELVISSLTATSFDFEIKGKVKKMSSDAISAYWYRRGFYKISFGIQFEIDKDFIDIGGLTNFLNQEANILKQHVIDIIESKHGLGGFQKSYTVNKLRNLRLASEAGLDIPETHILTKKDRLKKLLFNQDLISKPITEGFIIGKESRYSGYTEQILISHLDKIENQFFPSLFQEFLNKKFEIRTFYLDGKFFSTAIFSQQDPQTCVDFRHYNRNKPNRTPTIELDESIQQCIRKFMETARYKTGSLDFVVTKDDRIVFLEINPIGQFEQVSKPGNYNLEKQIAQYLIHEHI